MPLLSLHTIAGDSAMLSQLIAIPNRSVCNEVNPASMLDAVVPPGPVYRRTCCLGISHALSRKCWLPATSRIASESFVT